MLFRSGFSMLNTHIFDHVKFIEENNVKNYTFGDNLTRFGEDWQPVEDSELIMFYHGFKNIEDTEKTVNYLILIEKKEINVLNNFTINLGRVITSNGKFGWINLNYIEEVK